MIYKKIKEFDIEIRESVGKVEGAEEKLRTYMKAKIK